ncbi:MAG: alternative ribosome rescue aminoacyl-tRNA hydrolase ArfB [Actinomycetota bacterium]
MGIEVDDGLTIPDAELTWRFGPSGGPGGQHANRANTRAELTWDVAGSGALADHPERRERLLARLGPSLTVVADDERSQSRNRDAASRRLAQRVREASVVPRRRRPTRPTAGSKRRRLDDKRARGRDKQLRRRPANDD